MAKFRACGITDATIQTGRSPTTKPHYDVAPIRALNDTTYVVYINYHTLSMNDSTVTRLSWKTLWPAGGVRDSVGGDHQAVGGVSDDGTLVATLSHYLTAEQVRAWANGAEIKLNEAHDTFRLAALTRRRFLAMLRIPVSVFERGSTAGN